MTLLVDLPPWLCLAYCFASVIVWTENLKKMLQYLTALFVLFWQWNNQRRWRPVFWGRLATTKKCRHFLGKSAPQRKSWLRPWLRVTWLEDFLTSKWPGSFTALAPPLLFLWRASDSRWDKNVVFSGVLCDGGGRDTSGVTRGDAGGGPSRATPSRGWHPNEILFLVAEFTKKTGQRR